MHATHGRAEYNIDLLSPAALTLLRRAEVIDPEQPESDVAVVAWEFTELPERRRR
jgi:hypothetical protein